MQKPRMLLVITWWAAIVLGCVPNVVSENTNLLPTQTKDLVLEKAHLTSTSFINITSTLSPHEETSLVPTAIQRDTPILLTPSIFYEELVKIQITTGVTGYDTIGFDFDASKTFVPDELSENDLEFAVSRGTDTFVTTRPINGAADYLFEKPIAEAFSYSDCNLSASKFKTGGRPIHENLFLCVKTTKGNLVEMVINDIYKIDNIFYIEIMYIIWNEAM